MKMWKQWMALLMIFCLLMPGALAGSIDLTDDLDEEVGSVTESSAGEDYTISDNGDIILDDDDDLGGDVFFDDDGSTIEITDNEIDDTIDPADQHPARPVCHHSRLQEQEPHQHRLFARRRSACHAHHQQEF